MPNSILSAEEISERHLLAALKLWRESDYLSALTLAGAAEEILGRRLRRLGREPSFNQLQNEIVALVRQHGDTGSGTEKLLGELLNQTRNELKHYAGDDSLSFDLRADAAEMLERAIANYQLLTGVVLEEVMHFWGDISTTQQNTYADSVPELQCSRR